jgi:hypothetical protein
MPGKIFQFGGGLDFRPSRASGLRSFIFYSSFGAWGVKEHDFERCIVVPKEYYYAKHTECRTTAIHDELGLSRTRRGTDY